MRQPPPSARARHAFRQRSDEPLMMLRTTKYLNIGTAARAHNKFIGELANLGHSTFSSVQEGNIGSISSRPAAQLYSILLPAASVHNTHAESAECCSLLFSAQNSAFLSCLNITRQTTISRGSLCATTLLPLPVSLPFPLPSCEFLSLPAAACVWGGP